MLIYEFDKQAIKKAKNKEKLHACILTAMYCIKDYFDRLDTCTSFHFTGSKGKFYFLVYGGVGFDKQSMSFKVPFLKDKIVFTKPTLDQQKILKFSSQCILFNMLIIDFHNPKRSDFANFYSGDLEKMYLRVFENDKYIERVQILPNGKLGS